MASTSGNTSQATNILSNALQNNGGASERVVVSLSQQLAGLQRGGSATAQLTSATQGLGSTLGQVSSQLSSLGGTAGSVAGSIGQLAGSFGTLGGIGAAIGLGKVAVDLSVAGANADLLRTRFDGLAVAAGTTGDALIAALRTASGGEISDLNLTLAANKAQLLGVADSAEEFGVLMGIARDRAQQMGISTTQAFNDLTTGLGRGSALILDNLGIIVSVKEANEQYAASLGKTAAALTEAEQKQALINQVLAQGRASFQATGGAVQSQAGVYAQFSANIANAGGALGSFLSGGLAPLAGQFNETAAAAGGLVGWLRQLGTASTDAASAEAVQTAALAAFDAAMTATGDAAQAEAAYQAVLAAARRDAAAAAAQATADAGNLAGAYDANRVAALANADATAHAGTQQSIAAAAARDKANADQLAGVNAQISAFAQQQLADAAQKAAAALLAGGAAGAATAARLAGSSNQVDVLTAAYYRLAAAQSAAKAADPLHGVSEDRTDTVKQRAEDKSWRALEANRALLAKIAADKAKAAGGGGGPKLSDQQKLNNQLLTDQEAADAKFEDAEAAHQDRLLKIQLDFAKKSLAQQKLNEVGKRQSQADFYDALTSSDLNKKQGGTDALKQIDADYQAAYQKSQELAQAGNAKLAAEYLALKSKQAADELRYQESLAKAKADKDKGEVSRLESIHKLRQDAAAEEEKQLLAGGDANVTEKQAALDEEAAKNLEAQEKIGTASERAADRKVLAAERAGKAIDAEQIKLNALKSTYDQILPSGTTTTTTTGAGSTPAAASAAASAVPAAGGDIAAAINGMRDLLSAIESATTRGADKVAGAVSRAAGGKLMA